MSEPKRPGRPPLDDRYPSVNVSVRLPTPQYDSLIQLAHRERVSISDVIRRKLDDDDADNE
jgi:hypothetical protein